MEAKDTQAKASNAADRDNKSDRVDNIDRVNRVSKVLNVSNDNHTQHTKHGWEVKKLGEVCESDLGKTLNQSKDKGLLRPYLCAINVLWDKFDLTTLKETRFEDSELERYSVKKGDLLICEGGDIGRAAIWNSDIVMLYQNALHRVRLNKSINSRFVLLYLRHLKKSRILDTRYGKGVTIKHLVKSSLLSIPIPIPPMDEQERIVRELDCLSGVIERKRDQLKQLDALAQSIFYNMFGDPISNEKGWKIDKLGNLGEIIAGSTPSTTDDSNWGGNINWVTPAELNEQLYYGETIRKITEKAAKSLTLMPIGTVLLSSRAPIGKLAITTTPMCCNQGFKNIICSNRINNVFLYHYLKLTIDDIKALGRGATFKEVSKKNISDYKIYIPPLSLQEEFADKIEAIETQKELLKRSIKEVETLFDARMDYYFGDT